ncbi:MAG TPA: thioesterase family protein [Candidatus Obscuribacterales bacterium]
MQISVGTYDIDFAGHVSNIVYLRWFEALRLKIFEDYYPLQPLMERGLLPIIASHHIEYKRPVKLFDKPTGHMWIESAGSARMIFQGEIRVGGEAATTATHVGLFVDSKSMRPVRIPKEILDLIRKNAG